MLPGTLPHTSGVFLCSLRSSRRASAASAGLKRYAVRSGFKNLFLAGDWTLNGLNYGCVEAAVMSGMQAARAITGSRRVIFGENFPAP